jgi:hypothetical protein
MFDANRLDRMKPRVARRFAESRVSRPDVVDALGGLNRVGAH